MAEGNGLAARLRREGSHYGEALRHVSRNTRLYFASIPLNLIGLVADGLLYSLYLLERGYTESLVGQVNAAVALGVIIGGVPAGLLYTRHGARPAFVISIVGMAAARLAQLAATDTGLIILFGLAQGVGYAALTAIWPPFLTDEAPPAQRTHIFSLHQLLWALADFLGGILGGLFPRWFGALFHLTTLADAQLYSMVVAIGMTLLATFPLLLMQPGRAGAAVEMAKPVAPSDEPPAPTRRRGFIACAVVVFFVGLVVGVTGFFNVYFRQVHHATTEQIGLIVSLSRLTGMLGVVLMPAFAARVGLARGNVVLGLTTAGLLLALVLPVSLAFITPLFLAGFTVMRMNNLMYVNLVMEAAAPRDRGTQSSVRITSLYLAQAVSGVLGGWLVVQAGYAGLLVFGAVSAALAGLASWLFYRHTSGRRDHGR